MSRATNVTDSNGNHMFIIDTTGFTNGQYVFKMWVVNDTTQAVARGDMWGVQISSLALEFDIDNPILPPCL